MHPTSQTPAPANGPAVWRVCLPAALALAVAMGIGRFAFTPLLPLMQRDGLLDLDTGAWLAAVNYAGYLAGALSAARLAARPRQLVLASLFGIAAVTAGAGLTHLPALWMVLRAAAGVLSAWALIGVSAWSGGELARLGRSDAAGGVFTGVGLGIAVVGALAWRAGGIGSSPLWLALGGVAAVAAALVQRGWPVPPAAARSAGASASMSAATTGRLPRGSTVLVVCYGAFGFGYILPATYLPSMARAVVDDPRLFGLAWPVFGLAAAASTWLAARVLRRLKPLDLWAACHVLMAAGCALPLFSRSGVALSAAACAVGGTFMVATMIGLQQARRLCPIQPAPLLARMTAAFALGQIAGPLVALGLGRLLARTPWHGVSGIEATLAVAAVLLLASALCLRQASNSASTPQEPDHEPAVPPPAR